MAKYAVLIVKTKYFDTSHPTTPLPAKWVRYSFFVALQTHEYDAMFAPCVAGCLWPGFVCEIPLSCTILGSTTPGEREEGKRKEVKGRKKEQKKKGRRRRKKKIDEGKKK